MQWKSFLVPLLLLGLGTTVAEINTIPHELVNPGAVSCALCIAALCGGGPICAICAPICGLIPV